MNLKSKIKDYDRKINLFHSVLIFYSILTLFILAILSLFNIHFVKEMININWLDKIFSNFIMQRIAGYIIIFMTYYIILRFASDKIKLWHILLISLLGDVLKLLSYYINIQQYTNMIIDFILLLITIIIFKGSIKRGIFITLIVTILQILISIIRNYYLNNIMNDSFSLYFIVNIDLFIILYNILKKGGRQLCGNQYYSGDSQTSYTQSEVSSSESLKRHIIWLKELFPILKKPRLEEKKLAKQNNQTKHKLSLNAYDVVYIILFVLWNAFQIWLVYCLAKSENKTFEIFLLALTFAINKSVFGLPLHFKGHICFLVSMIYFYICSKSLPLSSFSILLPLFVGISTALICTIIKEIIDDEKEIKKKASLRDKIKEKTNNKPTYDNIYNICINKNYTQNKAKDIADTVYTYLSHSQYETASLIHCDNRTVSRRINEFLKD